MSEKASQMHLFGRVEKPVELQQGRDSVFADENQSNATSQLSRAGAFRQVVIPQEELWATSKITGKGKFICKLAVQEAFRTTWKYVSRKGSQEPLPEPTLKLIDETDRMWKVKKTFKAAVTVARALGHCVICRVHADPFTKSGPMRLKIAPYGEMDVEFAEGLPTFYNVYMKAGHNRMKVRVPAAECVALVNDEDPFENGTLGTSELLASYFPIKFMMNMLEGYSKIVLQRGLGFLDVRVEGATEPELAAYELKFGDPTQYSTLFHDEKVTIAATSGMQAGHNPTDTLKMYTREISSGCGIGENRLDGVQTYVTGAESDQDNYAAIGQTIQEDYMDALIATFILCNPKLKEAFYVEMPIEIKMGKLQEAQLRATEVGSIMQAPELFNLNYAMDLIGQPPPDGLEEGKLSVAQYIHSQQDYDEADNPENFDDTTTDQDSQDENNEKNKNDQDSQKEKKPISQLKKERAKALMTGSDSLDSIPKIREQLTAEFGSSLSNTDLVSIRADIAAKKKEDEKTGEK